MPSAIFFTLVVMHTPLKNNQIMPKASKKTMKVTQKKENLQYQRRWCQKKGNGKLLKLEHIKSSALLLMLVLMASSWSNFWSPKVMAMDIITSRSLHANCLFASSWLPLTKFLTIVPTTANVQVFLVAIDQIFDNVADNRKEAFIGHLFNDQTQDKTSDVRGHFFWLHGNICWM